MSGPVIGLSAYSEPAQWAVWQAPAVLLPASYVQQVTAAGGIPVLLPPLPGVAAAVSRLDGLILTGGGDIDPARYGEAPHPRTTRVSEPRDAAELDLLDAALEDGLPVLGICRGMQLLNVARGGTLRQHLPEDAGHVSVPGTYGSHPVRVGREQLLQQGRVDGARAQRVHPDLLAGELHPELAAHGQHAALGRGVGDL